ncbi:Protein of unknown function [Prevotellaceae bacterium HUN156]|nr:Protein of unknown function [Prevotellaceae bacterium HUN156]
MRILLLYMMLLMGSLNGWAQQRVTYQRADSLKICRLLRDANKQTTTLWFARQFLNIPYVAHTLEVNSAEQLVVNTRQLDCTTLVETVTALTLCAHQGKRSWNDFLTTLRTLRYRKGKLDGYPSRLHYFSDWIADKTAMSIVKEIQSSNPPFSAVQHINVNYMSTHPDAYQALKAHPEWVSVIRQQEETLSGITSRYIPKSALKRNTKALRQAVHDGDIIAITCNKKGLDIAHLGFAVWKKDGLHLLNASQIHKKVVQEPMTLYQYLQKHPSHTGIRIIRINQ